MQIKENTNIPFFPTIAITINDIVLPKQLTDLGSGGEVVSAGAALGCVATLVHIDHAGRAEGGNLLWGQL